MRVWVVLLLAVGGFAGCLGGHDVGALPPLHSFKAVYETKEGHRFTVTFGDVQRFFDQDGQMRSGYAIRYDSEEFPDAWSIDAVDAGLHPVRDDRCWVWSEDRHCGHREIRFDNGTTMPAFGIGAPWLRPEKTTRHDGLVTVENYREDSELAAYEYDFKPGQLWPQAYVRRAPSFDYEEVQWHLVSVEEGPAVAAGAEAWPRAAPVEATGPAAAVFPGADQSFVPLPFTIQQGVDALLENTTSAAVLKGGCVAAVWYWVPYDFPDSPYPTLPPISIDPNVEDGMMFALHRADGTVSDWEVDLVKDVLGRESIRVQAVETQYLSKPFPCSDREGVAVSADAFAAAIPEGLKVGRFQQFQASWWPQYDGSGIHLSYDIQYRPEDGSAHWRSATMDATTGLWTWFTYKPGDQVDPS